MTILDRMLQELPFNRKELALLIATAPRRYKVHQIKKRKGGLRTIAQPTAEVKLLQRWLCKEIISKLPLHDAAIAYRKGGCIKRHAEPHATHKYLLKLDFKDFFPSITADAFEVFVKHSRAVLIDQDVEILRNLLFFQDRSRSGLRLSIGAPSSPAVSNAMLFTFDQNVHSYCFSKQISYTRYADDMAFSTNSPKALDSAYKFVLDYCEKTEHPKLRLNTEKTVNVSKKFRRELTGLVLSNDGRVTLGREKRRLIRAMIDRFARGLLGADETLHLRGLISYARSIDATIVDLINSRVQPENRAKLL